MDGHNVFSHVAAAAILPTTKSATISTNDTKGLCATAVASKRKKNSSTGFECFRTILVERHFQFVCTKENSEAPPAFWQLAHECASAKNSKPTDDFRMDPKSFPCGVSILFGLFFVIFVFETANRAPRGPTFFALHFAREFIWRERVWHSYVK